MVNYSNGKIYKIVPTNGDNICYIGSTTKQYLSQRMDSHRACYRKWEKNKDKNLTTSVELFEKYGIENCKIVLIENFPCNSKDELEKREGEYIKTLNCINKRGAGGVSISGMVRKEKDENDNISVVSDDSIISCLPDEFRCPECGNCFNTKQGLRRHISFKHKELVWETVVESPPMTVNELIETDPLISIVLDDRGIEPETQTGKPLPGDETEAGVPPPTYLITLIREYEKYQHLFPAIKRRMKWEEANRYIDMDFYIRRHNTKMKYILFKIALLNSNIN